MAAPAHRLLLIEDNEPLGLQMVRALDGAGYRTDWIRRGDDAFSAVFDDYSLVVLDLMLPGASGFDVLEHLRRKGVGISVLIASALTDSENRLRARDLGATDYLTKPSWPQELLERVAAHLARPDVPPRTDLIEIGKLTIDVAARDVRVGDDVVVLSRAEFDVLAALARRRGAAVSRTWLLEQMSGDTRETGTHVVDRHVKQVKKKIGPEGGHIRTVWGVGYRMDG